MVMSLFCFFAIPTVFVSTLCAVPEFWFKGDGFEDGFDGTLNWEEALADVTTTLSQPIVKQPGGKSFDELLAERGGTESIVILAK